MRIDIDDNRHFFEYQKIPLTGTNAFKIGRLSVGYPLLIENAQEADASHWHEMLDTFQINFDDSTLTHLNNQLSTTPVGQPATTPVGQPVFLFEAPENGLISVVQEDGKYLFLFKSLNFRFWEIPVGNIEDTTQRPLGNTLVFAREPFNDFEVSNVHDIIKETLINWAVNNKGGRLFFLGAERITRQQTTDINGNRRTANQVINSLINLDDSTFDTNLLMPLHNYFLPVKEGDIIPLFYINNTSSANLVKFKIGISDISLAVPVNISENWTWFHALEFIKRKSFHDFVLQQQNNDSSHALIDYERTNILSAWSPSTLNRNRISKINYKNLNIFNPIQNETPTSQNTVSANICFFHGDTSMEVHGLSESEWETQELEENLNPCKDDRRPRRVIPPVRLTGNQSISVNTPGHDDARYLKTNRLLTPQFNIIIPRIENYEPGNNADNEYYLDNLIERVRDIRFRNSGEINNWFNSNYGYGHFIDWYNANMTTHFTDIVNTKIRFNSCWDNVSKMFPSTRNANFIQFICLMMESTTEVGWAFSPIGERGDLSDAFSYNKSNNENILASDLFQAGSLFRRTHENNAGVIEAIDDSYTNGFSNNQLIKNSTPLQINDNWSGHENYPNEAGYSINTRIEQSGMISQADFYKFRGRGIIQNTWRGAYKRLITEVLSIRNTTGIHPNISRIGNRWYRPGRSEDDIATISTNQDWDTLFQHTDFHIACYAVHSHSLGWNPRLSYWDIPMDTQELLKTGKISDRSIWSIGQHINPGNPAYAPGLVRKVMEVVKKLSI